jgi:alkaline phosphatase D
MQKSTLVKIVLCTLLFSFQINSQTKKKISKIAFGSCSNQSYSLPIFNNIVNHDPDLFIFLGDNIYGDTKDMDKLKSKYERLLSKDSYINLKKNVPIIATWDDHDYGLNDAGKNYPLKEASKEIFLEAFDEPKNSERRNHKGIYHSYEYGALGNKVQVILLDTRTFRDDLKRYQGEADKDEKFSFYYKSYSPHTDSTATILGKEQWNWLEKELKKPADIRIIGSGTQFGIKWNGYESWANFPHEQQKILKIIEQTKANGVFFISGDVHYSEISKLNSLDIYPIYDFTSSGLSSTWEFATPNDNRIEGPVMENHFGLITIDWDSEDTCIKMETWDIKDNQRIEYSFSLKEIQFKK